LGKNTNKHKGIIIKNMRKELYADIEPFNHGLLPLDGIHTMYFEECGNPKGIPVLFLHGGPGTGCDTKNRRFFDPKFYRIILFDQRGAGRSHPAGSIEYNTTQHLIEDIEKLREHLKINQWLIFGGSWGSALALAYGETYPDKCMGFILRGVFLSTQAEYDWLAYGARTFFPQSWQAFYDFIPPQEHGDIIQAYYKRLTNPDPQVYMPAARAFNAYELSLLFFTIPPLEKFEDIGDQFALNLARLEAHYFVNKGFLQENQLLENINRIRGKPCRIVQGRCDAVTPIVFAYELSKAWPEADYIEVQGAGHTSSEPAIREELMKATEDFKSILRK
jgi:proline iminopeptidase